MARDVEDLRHKVAGLADALQALGGPMGQGQGVSGPHWAGVHNLPCWPSQPLLVRLSTANGASKDTPCVVSSPQAGPPGGAPAGASDSPDARRRNPIAVTAGPLQDGAAKALAGPGGKGAVMDNPDGELHVRLQ